MNIKPADIAALKQRIKSDMDAVEKDRARLQMEFQAVEVLERRVQAEQAEGQLPFESIPAAPAPALAHSGLSFAESVRRAIAEFQDKTFTVRDVENMLKAMKAPLPANNLRPRIAGEIKGEIVRKRILLVLKGTGHVPHQYRAIVRSIPETERAPVRSGAPSVQQH